MSSRDDDGCRPQGHHRLAGAPLLVSHRLPGGRVRTLRPSVVAGVLVAASIPVLRRLSAESGRARVPWSLVIAHALKLGGGIVAMRTIESRYGEGNDFHDYHRAGLAIAPHLREGRFAEAIALARVVPFDTQADWPVATNLVRLLNGGVYAICGPSKADCYLVFSSVGFWGTWCFRRAFTLGLPDGQPDSYTRMVFCWPSLLFWTSTVGKEAWMTLGFGTGALGMAHLMNGRQLRGLALGALGIGLTTALRPKAASYMKTRPSRPDEQAVGQAFSPPALRSIRDLPVVAASVLFRPQLWEVSNPQALACAVESTGLMVLSALRARAIVTTLLRAPRQPYLGFVLASLAACVVLLSPLSNFGLLARERSPALPFYLMLLCAGSARPRRL